MPLSGQITVATAGTAVQGPDVRGRHFAIVAHPSNTNPVFLGNDGSEDVSSTTGFALAAKEPHISLIIANLKHLWFDVTTNGEKLCWIKLN